MPVGASPDFPARLLVIDHGRDLAELTAAHPDVFTPLHVDSGRAGAAALHTGRYDIVLADLGSLSDLSEDATRAIARLARLGGTALIIAVSSTGSVSDAVSALQAGAHDCLVRPVRFEELGDRIAVLRTRHEPARRAAAGFRHNRQWPWTSDRSLATDEAPCANSSPASRTRRRRCS